MFVVVEGKVLDPVFYDRLFAQLSSAIDVRSIDTVDLPRGLPQRGKQAVLALFVLYRRQGRLVQGTTSEAKNIVFIVDRDLDGICGRLMRSSNLIYTSARDVEAEIHLHGNVERALSTALSATFSEAHDVAQHLGSYMTSLANLWREWLELGVLSWSCRSRSPVPLGGASSVNDSRFGPVINAKVHDARRQIYQGRSSVGGFSNRARTVRGRVRRLYDSQLQHLLIKGKWLPEYVEYLIKTQYGSQTFAMNAFGVKFTHSMLDTLNFSDDWAKYYHDRVRALL